jgi:hypothetical protein
MKRHFHLNFPAAWTGEFRQAESSVWSRPVAPMAQPIPRRTVRTIFGPAHCVFGPAHCVFGPAHFVANPIDLTL